MSGTQPTKPSNIIAREFRGARLYLHSVHAGRGMRWLADKTKAAKFLMPEALTICDRASREWGTQCAVLDTAGNLAQRINAPRFKVALIVENNAPSQYGVFDMADHTTFNGRLVARYSTDYHAEQYARALELNHAKVQS